MPIVIDEPTRVELIALLTGYLDGRRSADEIYAFEMERCRDDAIDPSLWELMARLSVVAGEVDRRWAPAAALASAVGKTLAELSGQMPAVEAAAD